MNSIGPKRTTDVTLDEALVREARSYTSDLSATLEQLLADYMAAERRRRCEDDAAIKRVIEAFNKAHETTGLLSDEFCDL